MRAPAWLLLLWPLVTAGCATSAAYHPQNDCIAGSSGACMDWGAALVKRGEDERAELAYRQGCEYGNVQSCLLQGQLMTKRGELDAAEIPLRKAYLEELPEGYEALADLYQARGDAHSQQIAEGLRFEAPAIDKPFAEFISRYQVDARGKGGTEILLNVQPMLFLSRRLTLGAQLVTWSGELNGFVGYQYFASPWAVPYARAMIGKVFGEPPGQELNYGGEIGLKLCLGPLGHLEFAAGSSRASPLHLSMGLGINAIVLLLAAAR